MNIKDNNNKDVKQTRLDENSEIYNKNRTESLEEGEFRQMSFRDKLFYFREYYLSYTLIALALIFVSIYVIVSLKNSGKGKDAFYCAMIDGLQLDEETMEALPEDFSNYLENETDYTGYINAKDTTFDVLYATYTDEIKLDGFFDQRKFDVFILRDKAFTNYVAGHTLLDLSTVLSKEKLEELDSRLIYVIDKDTGNEIPYGILLDDINYTFQDGAGDSVDPPILTIPVCTKRIDAAKYFIDFILS